MEILKEVSEKIATKAWGATGNIIEGKTLEPMEFERNPDQADEVLIERSEKHTRVG